MASNTEKMMIVLLAIGIMVSAGNLYFLLGLSRMPDRFTAIQDKLISIESALQEQELFLGERELYTKAREEGSLIIYTVWDVEDTVALLAEFQKRYPGISTTYWQANNREIQARVLQEYAAEQKTVDVIASTQAGRNLYPEGAIMSYTSVQNDKLIIKDPNMPVVNIAIGMIAYNTKVLEELNLPAPENYEDIVNPIYKHLVCLDDPMRGGSTYATLYYHWNDETRWTNYIKGIKALDVPVHSSQSAEMRLVVAGEYAIGIFLQSQDVISEQLKGAPIDYARNLDPVPIGERYASIYMYAPHINAAKLFAEWLLTLDAQLVFARYNRTPNRIGVPSTVSLESIYPEAKNVLGDPEPFRVDPEGWRNTYLKPVWEGS